MLIAIVFTVALILSLGMSLAITVNGDYEVDYGIGTALFAVVLSVLGWVWIVSTLGLTGFVTFYIAASIFGLIYLVGSAYAKGSVYYHPIYLWSSAIVSVIMVFKLWAAV